MGLLRAGNARPRKASKRKTNRPGLRVGQLPSKQVEYQSLAAWLENPGRGEGTAYWDNKG